MSDSLESHSTFNFIIPVSLDSIKIKDKKDKLIPFYYRFKYDTFSYKKDLPFN